MDSLIRALGMSPEAGLQGASVLSSSQIDCSLDIPFLSDLRGSPALIQALAVYRGGSIKRVPFCWGS